MTQRADPQSQSGTIEAKPAIPAATMTALTVLLPLYNEAGSLSATLDVVLEFAAREPDVRFVFVDDGSRDATLSILRERLGGEGATPNVAFISYPENRGKGHAIRTGIAGLRGSNDELVVFMDGDMAYGLDHLAPMVEALTAPPGRGGYEVVIGSRRESPQERRNTRKLRRLMGWTFNRLVQVGMGLPFEDTQAGLKGFHLGVAREVFPRVTLRGFAFDVEALFIAKRLGHTIGEIPARVARAHRRKPSNVNLLLEPVKMAGDLLRIRLNALLGRYR